MGPTGSGTSLLVPLINAYPLDGFPTPISPTSLTATTARVFPFKLYTNITVAGVYIRVGSALASPCLNVGFYDTNGNLVLSTGISQCQLEIFGKR